MDEKNLLMIESSHGGRRYYYAEYTFHQVRQGLTKNYYRCTHYQKPEKCPVRLTSLWNGTVKTNGKNHNHDYDSKEPAKAAMMKDIRTEARETEAEPMEILRSVSREYPKDIASEFSGPAINSYVYRVRMAMGHPKVPKSLEELGNFLDENAVMKTMVGDNYVGAVQPTDNGTGYALLFANPDMLTELNLATIIEVDGTMKAVPTKPEATQMWIVSFRKHNQSFAAVHAYCRGARGELYEAIFKRLISLAPGLLNVELIISDFEGAVHKACRKVFPRARLQGCWFHFIKATSEYWKVKCQLNQLGAPRQAKYLTRSLALLPPQQIALGVDAIEEIVNSFTDDFPELKRYIKYLRTQWQPKAELLSVYDSAIRTNNDSEAYNRHYTPRVGGSKVKVFPLIRNLQLIIDDESTKMSRLNKGKPISKTKKTAEYYNKDMLIMEAQSTLQSRTQHLETSERDLIRQEVYCFLKKCLTPKIQDRINEEETKQFTRNDGNQTNQNRDNSGEFLSLDPNDDAEYGVKPKRKRLPRLREHSFDLPKQPSVSTMTAQECEDSATAITAGGASLNSGTIFEKDDEHIDHDWVVLTYLFEEGHGQHCPYTL